jgi:hypothetical protein
VAVLSILFGAVFTLASAYALGALLTRRKPVAPGIALALGSVGLSLVVFVVLLCGWAHWWVFCVCGVGLLACAGAVGALRALGRPAVLSRKSLILLPYLIWYFVNALAPETAPDGITYHLGLPLQYLRTGGFPEHPTFYSLIPQGMEMLYTMAFAFGRHSAAKLVEFALFAATLPLIFRVGRQLGLSDLASLVAAALYFCAPVAGMTGSSSYNDAAGVFFLLAAFSLLLDGAHLLAAGALAGFCYAIKMPGILVPITAILYALRYRKRAVLVAAGAALVIAPWMLRNAIVTGNPVAPLMNSVFPNPYFHVATETELANNLRTLGTIKPARVPWELAFGDHLMGTFGPLFLALPVGLIALRRREGRLLWAAAILLALPWITNSGARFLMPSVVLAGFALGMSLPRAAAIAAIAIQAVACWPNVIDTWETRYAFRLHEFPLAAALRLEPEAAYCRRHLNEYNVAKMIERTTPPASRTLALATVASAYLDRDVPVSWQSAGTDQLLDTLRLAAIYEDAPDFDWQAEWPAQTLRVLRFRMPKSYNGEWDISEIQLYSADYRIFNSPQWSLAAWPNRWEAPLAFDGNPATRWRTWQLVRAGMYFEVNLQNPQRLTRAVLFSHTPVFGVPLEIYGQDPKGAWHLLSDAPRAIPRAHQDLRLEAARALRTAGFRYLLAPTGTGGNAPIGNAIAGREAEWGMELAGYAGDFRLMRIR